MRLPLSLFKALWCNCVYKATPFLRGELLIKKSISVKLHYVNML